MQIAFILSWLVTIIICLSSINIFYINCYKLQYYSVVISSPLLGSLLYVCISISSVFCSSFKSRSHLLTHCYLKRTLAASYINDSINCITFLGLASSYLFFRLLANNWPTLSCIILLIIYPILIFVLTSCYNPPNSLSSSFSTLITLLHSVQVKSLMLICLPM